MNFSKLHFAQRLSDPSRVSSRVPQPVVIGQKNRAASRQARDEAAGRYIHQGREEVSFARDSLKVSTVGRLQPTPDSNDSPEEFWETK